MMMDMKHILYENASSDISERFILLIRSSSYTLGLYEGLRGLKIY